MDYWGYWGYPSYDRPWAAPPYPIWRPNLIPRILPENSNIPVHISGSGYQATGMTNVRPPCMPPPPQETLGWGQDRMGYASPGMMGLWPNNMSQTYSRPPKRSVPAPVEHFSIPTVPISNRSCRGDKIIPPPLPPALPYGSQEDYYSSTNYSDSHPEFVSRQYFDDTSSASSFYRESSFSPDSGASPEERVSRQYSNTSSSSFYDEFSGSGTSYGTSPSYSEDYSPHFSGTRGDDPFELGISNDDTYHCDGRDEKNVERVLRNPISTVQKTIAKPKPASGSLNNLSSSSREKLIRQAALQNSLDASLVTVSLRPPGSDTPVKLYHYTTEDGAFGIMTDRFFRPKALLTADWLNTSARFGNGIYFTDIPPKTDTETILQNNYNRLVLSEAKTTEYCFEFLSKELPQLFLCDDGNGPFKASSERKRRIWICKVQKLELKGLKGKYYVRELNGFGVPKTIKAVLL